MRFSQFIFTVFVSFVGVAQAQTIEDVPNAEDFPEIGRYPGSFITSYKKNEYTSFQYPTQTLNYPKGIEEFKANVKTTEGERTTIVYEVPTDVTDSLLKVFRSIEGGLVNKDFDTILSCGGETNGCGQNFIGNAFPRGFTYSKFNNFRSIGGSSSPMFVYVGSLIKGNDRYIALIVAGNYQNRNNINYSIDVVKQTDLKLEELILTVDKITEQINSNGTVTLGGLYFDHNEATLTEVSEPALKVTAEYLSKNDGAQYLVVGHTDNLGDFGYNHTLSENRAKSVINALGLLLGDESSTNLSSFGAAYAAPVESNETEEGRAKNRRVELVLVNRNNE